MSLATRARTLAVVVVAALSVLVAALPGAALPGEDGLEPFPAELDPISHVLPEHMTWDDWQPVPGFDWTSDEHQPPRKIRAALILADFENQPFVVEEMGLTDDPAQFYADFLVNTPSELNSFHTINEYWLENSYGLIGVEVDVFGPYTLPGKLHEYGLTSGMNDPAKDCPSGDTCNRNLENAMLEVSLADVTAATIAQGRDYEFRYFLHAGWDESGVWEEFGPMIFSSAEDVADIVDERVGQRLGNPDPDREHWAKTRYQRPDGAWTSFWAASMPWANALPGVRSLQGESDGAAVYAHELSHIFGVLDNYNNPHAPNPERSYSGPWANLSRGTFNGPGGPHNRWQIPATQGATMGAHHMLRNKLRLGFITPVDVRYIARPELELGPVITTVLQREQPMTVNNRLSGTRYGINIVLGRDTGDTTCPRPGDMRCDGGGYDNYTVEVVNRVGHDSFLPDHGVLIAKTKNVDLAPFMWVVDSHPDDIGQVDYIRPDGTAKMYPFGDYRQLADATFKAGTIGTHPEYGDVGLASEGETTNTYIDVGNDLKFLILDQIIDAAGVMRYRVAVMKATPSPLIDYAVESAPAGAAAIEEGTVGAYEWTVTNTGGTTDVIRIAAASEDADTMIRNDLVELGPGEVATVTVHVRPRPGDGTCPTVVLTATSEGDTGVSTSVEQVCAGS
jgi:M6 family metalloprotease-like protein